MGIGQASGVAAIKFLRRYGLEISMLKNYKKN